MNRKHRSGLSWLAMVLCMALLLGALPVAPALAKSKTYTIKWKVRGETIKKEKVEKGEMPEQPEDPANYEDGEYTYVFKGWDPKVSKAKKDVTYKAKFKKTKSEKAESKVTITWLDDEGELIDFTEVKYGKVPKHEEPKKAPTEKYTYEFDKWEPKLVKATEDTTYTATFKEKTRKYKITWKDHKGKVIDQTKVAYGKMPKHDDPVRKSYQFTGWEPALTEVTGDATYTATFEKKDETDQTEAEKFTITWLDDEGNVIDTTQVKAGKKPTHDDPTKEPTEKYTYKFTGWEPKLAKAKADATYTATFEKKTRKYLITWLDDDGNVIDQTKVAYGKMPTHEDPTLPDSKSHSYVFRGWTPELTEVTGDAAYTAMFDEVEKKKAEPEPQTYTISWLDDAGNVIDTTEVKAGKVPAHDAIEKPATEQYTYVFSGWTPEPAPAEANAAYTAVFTEVPVESQEEIIIEPETEDPDMAVGNSVKVLFKYPDGTLIDFPQEYVEKEGAQDVYYKGTDPVKAATETTAYEWIGWANETEPNVKKYGKSRKNEESEKPLLPKITKDSPAETVYYAVFQEVALVKYTITWKKDDGSLIDTTQVVKGEKPTHADPTKGGCVFDGWLPDGGSEPIATADLPVATKNTTYTAKFTAKDRAVTLTDVNCHAYIKNKDDKKALKDLLPAKAPLSGGTEQTDLDWSKASLVYEPSENGDKNDGKYTYTLTMPDPQNPSNTLAVSCTIIVGKKQSGKYTYRWNSVVKEEEATAIITAWNGTDATLTVASTLDGVPVTAIDDGVFRNNTKLTSVTVPAGVTAIGTEAFAGCSKLATLTLPDSLTQVGMDLIDGCDKLENMILSVEMETTMDKDASGCYTIKHVDKTDPSHPVMTQTVTLPDGFPTDIPVTDPGELTLKKDFLVKKGHSVTASGIDQNPGKLLAEIEWLNDDNSLIETTEVAYGKKPAHDAPKSKKLNEPYEFKGWSPEIVKVTGPATYTAEFEQLYTVTFYDEDGKTELWKHNYKKGVKPKFEGNPNPPTKDSDAAHTYAFDYWYPKGDETKHYRNDELPEVTGTTTYIAHFAASDRKYTVKFVVEEDSSQNVTREYKYNAVPQYDDTDKSKTPSIKDSEKYTYYFEGWKHVENNNKLIPKGEDLPAVTADATYKASIKKYEYPAKLSYTYKGSPLTKVYDTNKNVFTKNASGKYTFLITAPKAADFKVNESQLIPGHTNVMIKVTSIKKYELFPKADVGSYTLNWTFGLQGDDAKYYTPQPVSLPTKITPREVVITPRAGLSKVYGTKDPVYAKDTYLDEDESSPLHQNIGGLPGYAVPLNKNAETGKQNVTITNSAYILKEAEQKGTKFFPGWLTRAKDNDQTHKGFDDVGQYKILIGDMKFSSNFAPQTLKGEVFTITQKDISETNVTVDKIADQTSTGKAITLEKGKLVVRYGTMTLIEGTDFKITGYENNTEVSTKDKPAKVKLEGIGNFKGTKEATFNIIKKSDSSGGGGSSGSGSGGYGYDGFEGEEEGEGDETGDENVGVLKYNDVDYGTILFGADGKPRPFTSFDEEIESDEDEDLPIDDSETLDDDASDIEIDGSVMEPVKKKRLIIVPDPLKDPETEEAILLPGTQREKFEELHLRLTNATIQALVNNGVTEIVYQLENSHLQLPLASLTDEIVVPSAVDANAAEPEGDDAGIDDEIEIEDADAGEDGDEVEIDDDSEVEIDDDSEVEIDDADLPVEETPVEKQAVDGYDFCIEQADATVFSDVETNLLTGVKQLTPAYRARLYMMPAGAEPIPTGEMDDDEQPITKPFTAALPEGYTLPDVVMRVDTYDSFATAPLEAKLLHLVAGQEPAAPLDLTDAETATENDALTPAVFDEEDDPIRVMIAPVSDGLYAVLVPADWDATPYLSEPEADDEEEEPEGDGMDEDEDDAGEEEVEFEDDTPAPEAPESNSVYEYAFIRGNMEYQMYYVFDTDDMVARRFVTNDTGVKVGTFTGDAETGFKIIWGPDWSETMKVIDERKAMLIDKDGKEWEYRKVQVEAAEDVLNQPGYHDM